MSSTIYSPPFHCTLSPSPPPPEKAPFLLSTRPYTPLSLLRTFTVAATMAEDAGNLVPHILIATLARDRSRSQMPLPFCHYLQTTDLTSHENEADGIISIAHRYLLSEHGKKTTRKRYIGTSKMERKEKKRRTVMRMMSNDNPDGRR